MDKKSSIIIAVILVLALVGYIAISFQRSATDTSQQDGDFASTTEWENAPAEEPKDIVVTPKTVITAKHAYQGGAHIVAGEIPLPSPCHILEANGTASADKKQVFIELLSSVKTGELCAQVITPARYKVTVKADKSAKISATLNGQEVTLNLIEAGPNENLDNFELYIKG